MEITQVTLSKRDLGVSKENSKARLGQWPRNKEIKAVQSPKKVAGQAEENNADQVFARSGKERGQQRVGVSLIQGRCIVNAKRGYRSLEARRARSRQFCDDESFPE